MSKLAMLISALNRNPESKAAALATAATTGITIAKFLGKRSIYGAVAGIGMSLVAKKMMKRKLAAKMGSSPKASEAVIDHEPLRPDPNAPERRQ